MTTWQRHLQFLKINSQDDDIVRKGQLLQWLIFIIGVLSLIWVVLAVAAPGNDLSAEPELGPSFLPLIATLIFGSLCIYLIVRGRVVPAAHIFAITILVSILLLLAVDYPTARGLPYLLLIPVVAIALLDSIRASLIYTAVSLAATGLYTAVSPTTALIDFVFYAVVLLGVCLTVWVATYNSQRVLKQASHLASESQRETELNLRKTQILFQFNSLLATTLDVNEINRRSVRTLAIKLNAHRCLILTWQPEAQTLSSQIGYENAFENEKQSGYFWDTAVYQVDQYPATANTLASLETAVYQSDPTLASREQEILKSYHAASCLECPMIRGAGPVGLIWLFRSEGQPEFSASEVQLAQAMSNQTGVALANAMLTSDAQIRVAQLRTINRMSVILSHAPSLNSIFDGARREIMSLIPATGMSISLLTAAGDKLNWLYGYEYGQEVDLSGIPPLPISQGFMGQVVRSREMLYVDKENVALRSKFQPVVVGAEQSAWLGLPMIVSGELIGVLAVENEDSFSPREMEILKTIVGPLTSAIYNFVQFDRVQQNLAESQRLYEAGRQLNTATNAQEIYQTLIDFAADSQLVDLAQIFVTDAASPSHLSSPAHWSRLAIVYDHDTRFTWDQVPLKEQFSHHGVLVVEAGQTDPAVDAWTHKLFSDNDIQSATLLPMFAEDDWLGMCVLAFTKSVTLREDEIRPFIILADQAAVILSKIQLHQQTQTLYQIGRKLNLAITWENALNIVTREVAQYLGVSQCRFVIFDYQEQISVLASINRPATDIEPIPIPFAEDFVYQYFSQHKENLLLTADDPQLAEDVIQLHVIQNGVNASLLIPAYNQQEMMGYLAIDSRQTSRPFSQTSTIFAQTIVDQLVTQIENIKLLDEALQRAQELITLNQIQTNISLSLDRNRLAFAIYQQVNRLLDNTIFTLARYDAEANYFEPILHMVSGTEVPLPAQYPEEADPLYQFLQGNRYLFSDEITPLAAQLNQHLSRKPKAGLWIPMRQEGATTGLLSVQSYKANNYQEHDIQLLRSIATHANLVMANSEFFDRIQATNEELLQLDRLKNQFLANMSHELRTPLNSIIGFSRVILKGIDGPITAEQEEDLTTIYSNGQHLLNLINEILDMAKIEAGKMTLAFEEINLKDTAETVRNTVRGLIEHEKVDLIWEVEPSLPAIIGDPIRIRQILLNLLSNAAKFTLSGHIKLKMVHQDNNIHISVSDTGIGIAETDFEKIFTAFEQADSTNTRLAGGTGLGLPITKRLVEMHQGEIFFESTINHGSKFHVLLPIKLDQANVKHMMFSEPPL